MGFERVSESPRIEDVTKHFAAIEGFDWSKASPDSKEAPPGVVQFVWDRWTRQSRQQHIDTQRWANGENQSAVNYINQQTSRPITLTEYGVWQNTGKLPSGVTNEQMLAGMTSFANAKKGGGSLFDKVMRGIGSAAEATIGTVGRVVQENPALLFAAPFAVGLISSAVTGAPLFGGSASAAGAGSGAAGGAAGGTGGLVTTPLAPTGTSITVSPLGAGTAAPAAAAGGGAAALETIALPASATPIATGAPAASAAGAAAATPVLETIVPNASRLPEVAVGGGGLLSRIADNPIAGRIIEGLGGALADQANIDANAEAQRDLLRERQGLISQNYEGTRMGAPRVAAGGTSGLAPSVRFDPSYYDNTEFRYDPKVGRIVEVPRGAP